MTDKYDDFMKLVAQAQPPDLRPDDRIIEETLLAGLFTTAEAQARILEACRPSDFSLPHTVTFAKGVWPRLSAGELVDRVVFQKLLDHNPDDEREAAWAEDILGFADGVFSRAEADPPDLGLIEAYLSIFTEAARLRQARSVIDHAQKELEEGLLSPEGAAGRVFEAVADLEEARRLVGRFKSEAEDWPAYFAALKGRQDPANSFLGLDTGFSHLNNVINGLEPGTLIVLGAEPSTGKTTWAKQLGDQVAELNPEAVVLFVSLEQSREELRVKTLSRLAQIENRDILRGRLDLTAEGWARIEAASQKFLDATAGRFFILEGDRMTTPDRIRLAATQVRRLTQCAGLLIIVDYLQIVPTETDYRDIRSKVDAVVSDLKRVARDLGATVLAIASINRASYGKEKGTFEAFKESGGVEYGADVAGLLLRDRDTSGANPVKGVSLQWQRVNLDIVKNRNGERARIGFDFYPAISCFLEKDKSSLTEEGVDG